MRPFNLQEALAGKPVVTRSCLAVTQLTVFNSMLERPVYGLVGGTQVTAWTREGLVYTPKAGAEHINSNMDLFMYTEKKIGWATLWRVEVDAADKYSHQVDVLEGPMPTKPTHSVGQYSITPSGHRKTVVAVIPIEWEE